MAGNAGVRVFALFAFVAMAIPAGVVASHGTDDAGIGALIRATARTSALLYFIAFAAPGAVRLGHLGALLERHRASVFLAVDARLVAMLLVSRRLASRA